MLKKNLIGDKKKTTRIKQVRRISYHKYSSFSRQNINGECIKLQNLNF